MDSTRPPPHLTSPCTARLPLTPDFTASGDRVRYVIDAGGVAAGPLQVDVELRYQPIAFRWAQNLRGYDAPEPRKFVSYFDAMAAVSSTVLAHASATVR